MNFSLPQNPVFIVGSPRSGTTLLQSLMATQPGIYSFPETHYFSVIEKQAVLEPDNESITEGRLERALETIKKKLEFTLSNNEIAQLVELARQKRLTSKTLFESIVIHHLAGQNVDFEAQPPFLWVEKTPTHCNFIPRIIALYPAARVLHIVRHPVPAIFSRKQLFPFNRHTPLKELAHGWRRMQENVERVKKKIPKAIYSVRYEDLVAQLEETMLKVGLFLGIEFDLQRLRDFHRQETAFSLDSEPWKGNSRTGKISNTNNRYKSIVNAHEAELIETIVSEQMTRFGYHTFLKNND